MAKIEVISPNGRKLKVSEKAFSLFYRVLGFVPAALAVANVVEEVVSTTVESASTIIKPVQTAIFYTRAELGKMKKAELVAIAEGRRIAVVPDAMTNKQIIEAIMSAQDSVQNDNAD